MPLCKICKKPHKLFPFKKSLVFLEDVHNALVTSTCPPSILGCEECGQPNARLVKRDDATKAFCNTHCEEKYYASDEPCERCAKTNARWVGRERSKRFCNAACEAAHYVPTKKETFEGAVTCLSRRVWRNVFKDFPPFQHKGKLDFKASTVQRATRKYLDNVLGELLNWEAIGKRLQIDFAAL